MTFDADRPLAHHVSERPPRERPGFAGSVCAQLRRLLSDGRWHTRAELVSVTGADSAPQRLNEIRHGHDGGPAQNYECQRVEGTRGMFRYRLSPASASPAAPVRAAPLRAQSDAPSQSPLTPPRGGGCTFSWSTETEWVKPKPAPLVVCPKCGTWWRGGGEHARRIDGSDCLGRRP